MNDDDLEMKLVRWGIKKRDEKYINIPEFLNVNVHNWFINPEIYVSKDIEIEHLKKRILMLENMVGLNIKPSRVDLFYDKLKDDFKEKYHGKILAIDLENEKILAIENNILNAYKKAKEKSKKEKFGYKRVGYKSIYTLM